MLFAQAYIDTKLAGLREDVMSNMLETMGEWFCRMDDSSLDLYVSSFIGPVLDVLGFVRGELHSNIIPLFENQQREKALTICYIIGSNEDLDQTVKGKNYSVSLVKELKKANLNWGVLTNGRLWRLYYVKERAPFETFFQIELHNVLKNDDKAELALFTDFFNVQSFLVNEENKCPLDARRKESEDATGQIETHLQGKMEEILGKLCLGFIQSEGKKAYTEEEKRAVFNNSIYLLYRLLFILYAEARGFLPIQNPDYYESSITKIMKTVEESRRKQIENPEERNLWNILCEVFSWVNQGNHVLGIPPYNGGLFDDNEKSYLANHSINDAFLSDALFSLGFREKKGDFVPINYNDLSVRHLGGLYEGILEYQLFIAPERMVRRREKSSYRFIPESSAGKITRNDTVIEKGEVYFSQSSEERKMTGSYYTPEDIVRYIVENSLGQHLAEVEKELQTLVLKLMGAQSTAVDEIERQGIEKFIDMEVVSFLEKKVLTIKLLDPAMGSGHFLVNAVYYLTNFVVESLCSTDWENSSIDANPLLWRRKVVENCIFGVDFNPLATELAKLSLWLITADNRKPLTFLDHHLRTGNSLLGSNLDELGQLTSTTSKNHEAKNQITLDLSTFKKDFLPKVLKVFEEMNISSEEIADIERKKVKLKELERYKKNLQNVADIWLSSYFGNKIPEGKYYSKLQTVLDGKADSSDWTAANISKYRFFHWWLEFPEVFFPSSTDFHRGGFDVIVGNPPYGVELCNFEKDFVEKKFRYCISNKNTALIFVERSIGLVSQKGYVGLIVPKSLAFSQTWKTGRGMILEPLAKVVDVSEAFEDVLIEQMIIILGKSNKSSSYTLESLIKEECFQIQKYLATKTDSIILHGDKKDFEIFSKMNTSCKYFSEVTRTNRGLPLQKFVTIEKSKYRVLRGKNVYRYGIRLSHEYVPEEIVEKNKTKLKSLLKPKIISQRIVAHVTKPSNRLIIMSALDQEGLIDVDTVENTIPTDERYSLGFLLCLLNSKIVSWYAYRYIFSKAVRSMDLDSYYIGKIPLPQSFQENDIFDNLAIRIQNLTKSLLEMEDKNKEQIAKIKEDLRKTDSEIEEHILRIYGLTEFEKNIIESN